MEILYKLSFNRLTISGRGFHIVWLAETEKDQAVVMFVHQYHISESQHSRADCGSDLHVTEAVQAMTQQNGQFLDD